MSNSEWDAEMVQRKVAQAVVDGQPTRTEAKAFVVQLLKNQDEHIARIEVLESALSFYGDPATYRAVGHPQIDAPSAPIHQDQGARAREVLQ